MKWCSTASEVIDALGGTAAFAAWYGVSPNLVSDWRKRGFPSARYLEMSARLRERRIEASPEAWKLKLPQAAE